MDPLQMGNGTTTSRLWVFGYGSLCWRPGFEYNRVMTGYVNGFSRKFWQGNTTHRGTSKKPGRVATLVEEENGRVWGCAFEITGEDALIYLSNRECKHGGYLTQFTLFYPREGYVSIPPLTVMLYIATAKNDLWLGDAPLTEIARQITETGGECGHNVEYLLRLAQFTRDFIPEAVDEHLFTLEILVRARIKEQNLCMKSLMGNSEGLVTVNAIRLNPIEREQPRDIGERLDSFQFTARVPEKKLRCLKI